MTTADLSPAAAKAAFRGEIRAGRRARTGSDREQAASGIATHALPLLANSRTVACYISMLTEPGTTALINLLRQCDVRVLLPRVNGESLEWIELTDSTDFDESALGIREPRGAPLAAALSNCDAIVLPALAISAEGIRLGQGGGFYDRALQDLPIHADGGPIRVAVIFDDELVDSLPHESHDSKVDHVVTPDRAITF